MSCPRCNGFTYLNYCMMCGFPPDDAEVMQAFNREKDRDFQADSLEEQRNNTEGNRNEYRN
jgi:hypothetical protein